LFIDRNEGLFNTIAQPELRLKSRPGEMRGQSALQPVLCCLRSRKMTFVFAYLGSFYQPPGWPIHLMYLTEATFVIVTFVCVLFAGHLRKVGTQPQRDMVASTGGISASFGLIMPFELAPFFLGARGETMMASILLILVYPVAAALFIFLFARFMKPDQSPSDLRFDFAARPGATSAASRPSTEKTTIAPSPISPRRSGAIPNMLRRTTTVVPPTWTRKTTTTPSRTMTR
jgi:thiosulfate dehydrogenase (quinone) large subunit